MIKDYYEKPKTRLDIGLNFFYFKNIFIILLCILIVYYFLYLVKY